MNLPSSVKKIDAATTVDGALHLFTTRFVWKIQSNDENERTETREEITTLFPGLPNNLSAALSREENGKMISYFLKNDMMYLYDVR